MCRYFIDERVGCIAVRDSYHTDKDSPHLERNTKGVVRFWLGEYKKQFCDKCGGLSGSYWFVSEELQKEAKELCDRLNEQESQV